MRRLRGISPLVVALLLILIGIAASVVLYMWLTGFTSSATKVPTEMQINIRLEAAKYYSNTHSLIIYGRNIGTTSIDISALKDVGVYVYFHYNGTLAYANVTSSKALTDSSGNGVIEPGEAFTINITDTSLSNIIASGEYYDIKVVIAGVEAWLTGVKLV